jgi:HlyD family secretion protein
LESREKIVPPPSKVDAAKQAFWPTLAARSWRIALAAAFAVGLVAAGARWYVGPEISVDTAVRADLVRSVVASGHVETPFRVEIASQITATVAEVLVEEGQSVAAGQRLVLLASQELEASLVLAAAAVAQADARMRQLRELTLPAARETLKQAAATLANAKTAYARAESLASSGYGTRATLDAAMKDRNVARAQMRTAELQVFTSAPGGSDYVMAQTQLGQAEAAANAAKARLDYATIVAPRAGVLIARSVERGTVVAPGKELLVLAPAGSTQIVVQIDEKNLGLLQAGQKALVSADAYPDRRFDAVLTFINPSIDINRASVEVKLTVGAPPSYLRQDMTVSVDIEVARSDNAIVVPARSLRDAQGPTPWVLVVEGRSAVARPVRVGLRSADKAELLEGVSADDRLVPAQAALVAGQRLRAVAP